MIDLRVFIGEPIPFLKHTKIYPPTVKDVATKPTVLSAGKVFLLDQEEIREQLIDQEQIPTPFEFLLINAYHNVDFMNIIQQAFISYIHTKVTFLFDVKKIILSDINIDLVNIDSLEQLDILDENNFEHFSNLIAMAIGTKRIKQEPLSSNPAIAHIQLQTRKRERIKAKQQGTNGISLDTCLVAICCMGIGITPLNIGEMSYASVQAILKMMQNKEKYELDIKSLLAGADSKKVKPVYWIKND